MARPKKVSNNIGKAIEKEVKNLPKAAKKLLDQGKAAKNTVVEGFRKLKKSTGGR